MDYTKDKQSANRDNENQAIYKCGYQDGFEDGLVAARQCRSCEYINECQDDPQKTDYCPNAKLREHQSKLRGISDEMPK